MTRVGFFARADNGGLGAESWEFCRNYRPEKVLVIRGEHGHFPERFNGLTCQYADGVPTHSDLDTFLRGIDVLFSIETFYNWGAVEMARSRGIKTVLRVNYEMNLNQVDPNCPQADWFVVPSPWNYERISYPNKRLIPFPVNRQALPFKKKDRIRRFYFIAGHAAYEDRNGVSVLHAAMPYIQAPVRILTQQSLGLDFSQFPNVSVEMNDYENYWDVHQGDCLISPRRYGGQSLPLNEALSLGNPVIMPDISPQNGLLPRAMLFRCSSNRMIDVQGGRVECYDPDPMALAAKVNELYASDITDLSESADLIADDMGWESLLPTYRNFFREVHGQNPA